MFIRFFETLVTHWFTARMTVDNFFNYEFLNTNYEFLNTSSNP